MIASTFEQFANFIIRKYTTIEIEGKEHIPKDKPFIICANHASHLDSILLMHVFGKGFSNYALLAAYDYWFENKFRKYFFTQALNLIPVDRRSKQDRILDFKHTIGTCRSFLQKLPFGNLIIFAEGSRAKNSNEIKPGVAILASSLNIAIVVVQISGSNKVLPPKSRWFTKANISLNIYPPIIPAPEFSRAKLDDKLRVEDIIAEIKKRLNKSIK